MERNRILQAPVVEDFTCKFHDCKVFSKLDLRQGYRQLTLHPDSRAVATFSTPWGNMRPKRLIFGIPERVESDNGPLFNSAEFKAFAEEMGFKHHRVTPEHPRANGEAESFKKVLNKTEQIAHNEGRSGCIAIQNMLMGYRSTPHPATGYSPYEALMR